MACTHGVYREHYYMVLAYNMPYERTRNGFIYSKGIFAWGSAILLVFLYIVSLWCDDDFVLGLAGWVY